MAAERICSIPGCGKTGKLWRGWCAKHYARWRKHGDPLAAAYEPAPRGEPERFLREVALLYEDNDCLLWPYSRAGRGYAQPFVDGGRVYAHRWLCEQVNGPAPTSEHEAAHSCGNGHFGCVNPGHLSWKTHVENEADKWVHGTMRCGEMSNFAKLTEANVVEIRALKGEFTQRVIGEMYEVCADTVAAIHNEKSWAWLESEKSSQPSAA